MISAALKVLYLTGLVGEVAPEDEAAWIEIAVLIASFAGDVLAARARVVQTAAPKITGGKAA